MSNTDISYFQQRAETELERAQQAIKPEAVRAHYELANAYLERSATIGPLRQAEHA